MLLNAPAPNVDGEILVNVGGKFVTSSGMGALVPTPFITVTSWLPSVAPAAATKRTVARRAVGTDITVAVIPLPALTVMPGANPNPFN